MIILASNSKQRRKLLKLCIHSFKIKKYKVDETKFIDKNIINYMLKVVFMKIKFFVNKNYVVLAADTIILYKGKIIGKPYNADDAFKTLKFLQGDSHICLTAVFIKRGNKYIFSIDKTFIYMNKLNNDEIRDYIKTGEYKNKAGSYSFQDSASRFLSVITGDKHNIMGLPIKKVCKDIKNVMHLPTIFVIKKKKFVLRCRGFEYCTGNRKEFFRQLSKLV